MKKNIADPKTTSLLKTLKSKCNGLVAQGTKAARMAYLEKLNKAIAVADRRAPPTEKSEKNKLLLLRTAGVIHMRNRDYKAAQKNFARIISHPLTQAAPPDERVPAYLSLSIAYLVQEEYLLALKNLSAIRKLARQNYQVPLLTASVYRELDNYPAMLANCMAVQKLVAVQKIKLNALDKEILHENLAVAHSALNNEALARESLDILFKINPNNKDYQRVMQELTSRRHQMANFIKPELKNPEFTGPNFPPAAKEHIDILEKDIMDKMKNKALDSLTAKIMSEDCYITNLRMPDDIDSGR